jgi:hypothetical protein
VLYYGGKRINVLKQFANVLTDIGATPSRCVPVVLVPQCAELKHYERDAVSTEFIQKTRCYKNVTAIDWSRYTPF